VSDQDPNQLQIELSPEMADGIYSNLAIINHSNSEFVVDFIQMMPGEVSGDFDSAARQAFGARARR